MFSSTPSQRSNYHGISQGTTVNEVRKRLEVGIPSMNLKFFAQAIQFLGRVGKELLVEGTADKLVLRTINDAKSAYGAVFFLGGFFDFFRCDATTRSNNNEIKNVTCKILLKAVQNMFRTLKNVHRLVIALEDVNEHHLEPKLIFQMQCEFGIKKEHHFSIQDCEPMFAVFNPDGATCICSAPKKFISLLNPFGSSAEVRATITPDSIGLKSYYPESLGGFSCHKRGVLHTQTTCSSAEFDSYSFRSGTIASELEYESDFSELVFSLKESKAILNFCEATDMEVYVYAAEGGMPMRFTANSNSFSTDLILATMIAKVDNKIDSSDADHKNSIRDLSGKRNDQLYSGHDEERERVEMSASIMTPSLPRHTDYLDMPLGGTELVKPGYNRYEIERVEDQESNLFNTPLQSRQNYFTEAISLGDKYKGIQQTEEMHASNEANDLEFEQSDQQNYQHQKPLNAISNSGKMDGKNAAYQQSDERIEIMTFEHCSPNHTSNIDGNFMMKVTKKDAPQQSNVRIENVAFQHRTEHLNSTSKCNFDVKNVSNIEKHNFESSEQNEYQPDPEIEYLCSATTDFDSQATTNGQNSLLKQIPKIDPTEVSAGNVNIEENSLPFVSLAVQSCNRNYPQSENGDIVSEKRRISAMSRNSDNTNVINIDNEHSADDEQTNRDSQGRKRLRRKRTML